MNKCLATPVLLISLTSLLSEVAEAAYLVTPWSSAETSIFSPFPSTNVRSDSAVWVGNSLTLRYDSIAINNTIYPYSESVASFPIAVPTIPSSIVPIDTVGISFDFSTNGSFNDAFVSFAYDNSPMDPLVLNQIGTRVRDVAYRSTSNLNFLNWAADTSAGGNPTIVATINGDSTHVDFLFSQELLTYMDLLTGIVFNSRLSNSTNISGTASFANVSWLIDPGSSSTYTRWHQSEVSNSVSEPPSLALIALALSVLIALNTTRKLKS